MTATTNKRRNILELTLLAIACFAVLLLDASVNELHGTSVFYASLVREMYADGWLSIFEGPRAYFLKPPLVLWLSAAGAEVFGLNNLGVSLASRLAGVLSIALTYLLAKKLFNHQIAVLTAIVLLTNSTFIQFSATLRMDSMLLFGGLLSLYAWLARERPWASPALFLGITIGVLSKGPLGFAPLLLICLHAVIYNVSMKDQIRWRWALLLSPIVAWYAYLLTLHGMAPLNQLGADLAKPAADLAKSGWSETLREYVVKPMRRYLPFLPFMLCGALLSIWAVCRRHHPAKRISLWLLLWFALVFVAAAAKPDKDIRYLFMGLPVLAIFGAIALAKIQEKFNANWLPSALAIITIALAIGYNFGPNSKPDTRGTIALINAAVNKQTSPLVALGGYPIRQNQARRQNTHRDWVYFYLDREPEVLSWAQLTPQEVKHGDAFLLTNNRTHEKRLAEYDLTAKYKTIEMVYAVRQ